MIRRPCWSNVCEKSPRRSSSVGIRRSFNPPGSVRARISCDQKKNSLFLLRLNSVPGMSTGPPSVQAVLSNVYAGGSHCEVTPCEHCRRRLNSLPFQASSRL